MRRAPPVQLERAVDVGGHRVGRIGPGVLVDGRRRRCPPRNRTPRPGSSSPRKAGARGSAASRARRSASPPTRAGCATTRTRCWEDLGEVARVGELLPRLHLHHRGGRARDERGVRRRRDCSRAAQHLDVLAGCGRSSSRRPGSRRARRRTGRTRPRRSSCGTGSGPSRFPCSCASWRCQLLLRHVEHADLQHLVGLGVVDEIVQTAPRALELLEIGVVHDEVHLLGELLVELRDDRLDRPVGIRRDHLRVDERLRGERAHRLLDGLARLVGLRLELLVQQSREFVDFDGLRNRCFLGLGVGGHGFVPQRSIAVTRCPAGSSARASGRRQASSSAPDRPAPWR